MGKDVLVILMMAFGLFAILMFILFYIYAKKSYNSKHIDDNYFDEDELCDLVDIVIDGKIITFDANDYQLNKGTQVNVLLDNIIYEGIVERANYHESLRNIHETPRLLILSNNIDNDIKINENNTYKLNEIEENIIKENNELDEGEFIPRKKK